MKDEVKIGIMFKNYRQGGMKMAVVINADACIGCGACTGGCPVGALSMNDEGKSVCDEGSCISCGACVGTCPVEAISL